MQNNDLFDYSGVKDVMGNLELKFADFADLLKKANDLINANINVSNDSAIYGVLGADILDTWNESASTFGDFKENFSVWTQLIASAANSYAAFQNDTVKNAVEFVKPTGSSLKGVQDNRINQALRSGNGLVTEGAISTEEMTDGSKFVKYNNGSTATYRYNEKGDLASVSINNPDGTRDERYVGLRGNNRIDSYDTNGKLLSKSEYSATGVMKLRIEYNDNGSVKSSTTYANDGSIIENNVF